MMIQKQRNEIIDEMYKILQLKTGINTTQEGSIAKAMVDAFGEEMSNLYFQTYFLQEMAYLSTAVGSYLDEIGHLMGVTRKEAETDTAYRKRISESVYTTAGGNQLAIESVLNQYNGVAKYEYRKYAFGPGSFLVFIYPEVEVKNEYQLILGVTEALKEVVSEGIYFEVQVPVSIPVGLELVLQFRENTEEIEKRETRARIKMACASYLSQMEKDEVLIINEIIQRVMETSDKIVDMNFVNLTINGKAQQISNTYPLSNQRFVVGDLIVL